MKNKPLTKSGIMYTNKLENYKNNTSVFAVVQVILLKSALEGLKDDIDKKEFIPSKYKIRFKIMIDHWLGAGLEKKDES